VIGMRVLFATFPVPSHYYPMVPLGWAMRAAGHEVRVACAPSLTSMVTSAGLPAVNVPEADLASAWRGFAAPAQNGEAARPPSPADRAERAIAMFTMVAKATAAEMTAIARDWRADLIVYEPRAYAAVLAAGELGLPLARHLSGVDYTWHRAEPERPALTRLWQGSGVPDADPLGVVTIDPCPPSLQIPAPVRRHAIRYVCYNGPAVLPGWLREPPARRRVCIAAGSALPGRRDMVASARQAVAALGGIDAEVIVAAGGNPDLLEPIPAGFRVLKSIPLHLLLPTCDAIVHHGGAGITMTAAASGVPQLLLPDGGDRFLHASQLVAAGAGIALNHAEAEPAAILAAARSLLADPRYRQAAELIRQENAGQPAPADITGDLASLAAPALSSSGSR
jgi:UDP:flavonoid glycosyltransferase YjiC (YdhE family)